MMDDDEIGNFWDLARFHAKLNVAPTYFGPDHPRVVRPPAWAYGDTPEEADDFVARTDSEDRITTRRRPRSTTGGRRMPVAGSLSILCNGAGHPVALLEIEEVEIGADIVERFRVIHRSDS